MKLRNLAIIVLSLLVGCAQSALAEDAYWQRYTDQAKGAKRESNFSEAEKHYRAALERANFLHDQDLIMQSYHDIAKLRFEQGRYDDAVPMYRKSIGAYQDRLANLLKDDPRDAKRSVADQLVQQQMELADCYRAAAKYKPAELLYRDGLKTLSEGDPKNIVEHAHVQSELGDVLAIERKYPEAEALYKQAMPVFESNRVPVYLLDLLQDYETLLRATNRSADAEKIEAQIHGVREKEMQAVVRGGK